jgi:hypothetical protein
MAPSRLSSVSQFILKFTGLLRSSHALLGLLAVVCLLFFWLARDGFPFVANTSFVLFGLILLVAVGRFALKGPEAERRLPAITVSSTTVSIANIEVWVMQTEEFRAAMTGFISATRRPLPAPAGILEGPSSDPKAIREIPPEEAERLRKEDND